MGWSLSDLKEELGQFGSTIIEATGDRLGDEIRNRDGIASPTTQDVRLVDGQTRVSGSATPVSEVVNGTIRGIDPKMAMIAVAALAGLFFVSRRF